MSNIFKSNSRFSSLIDDIPKKNNDVKKNKEQKRVNEDSKDERFNSFKSERPIRNESRFRSFNERDREKYRFQREEEIKIQKELEEREKDRIYKESLKIENFPDLIVTSKKNKEEIKEEKEDDNKISYIEKLKKEDDNEYYEDKDLENLKPGWLLLKRHPITRKTVFKYHPETIIKEKEKTDQEIMTEICTVLAKLHEKRTQEYIELYGYDTWEKMFKFPDWREREAYLEEMDELENQTDESEYDDEEYE